MAEQRSNGREAQEFDLLDWHPAYTSCQRYFLDYAQHEPATQAVCDLINIRLPFQWFPHPVKSSPTPSSATASHAANYQQPAVLVSLIPYIRRLVVTAFDKPAILHGFFGNDYVRGVLPHVDCERRNYLFTAKHGGWESCKRQYDVGSGGGLGDESVPFLKPLDEARLEELTAAEQAWSEWLAMEDWMLGPRAIT
ncbi:hypothetical protein K470DRAFT_239836 [Piedraia hortae CBS 480.64]|uniref:Uncharacterized protein n=1 Tax=Piedraia hortae CBS 480.64 TaxID=1314780 RepID=A0A6A7CAB6_9PEZI|nr:hypothetical protein K470DRAFT_239836 [Piedraia hortae CBS 480.64]